MLNLNSLLTFANDLNGYILNDVRIPVELLFEIFSYVESESLLASSAVCKNWCILIGSYSFWNSKYYRKFGRPAKRLPWYLFYCLFAKNYFTNLLTNCNGEHGFDNWNTLYKETNGFLILEDPPLLSKPLPKTVTEFSGKTSCFSAVQGLCKKWQFCNLMSDPLLMHITTMFKPQLLASDWVSTQYGHRYNYTMSVYLFSSNNKFEKIKVSYKWGRSGGRWHNVKVKIPSYRFPLSGIKFEHRGMKLAGTVLKFDFDSMKSRS